jgi:hypothetical protein
MTGGFQRRITARFPGAVGAVLPDHKIDQPRRQAETAGQQVSKSLLVGKTEGFSANCFACPL